MGYIGGTRGGQGGHNRINRESGNRVQQVNREASRALWAMVRTLDFILNEMKTSRV